MTSKIARLEAQIKTLESDNAKLKERTEELEKENASLKLAASGALKDLPKSGTMSQWSYWREWEITSDAAKSAFAALAEWAARNYGYGDTNEQRQANGLGLMMSHHFGYWGAPLLWAAAAGMEDANWHTETLKLVNTFPEHFQPEVMEETIGDKKETLYVFSPSDIEVTAVTSLLPLNEVVAQLTAVDPVTPAINPVVEAIKALNVDALSPLEALTKLYELKRLVQS